MENKQLNILHIASGDLWAGAEAQLFTLATNLSRQPGTVIHVILLNHGVLEKKLIAVNIPVTVLDESKINGFRILWQLIQSIAKIRPDIVHTHRIKENILGSIAARLNNTPSIRTAHGAEEHRPAWFHVAKNLRLFIDWFCARFIQSKVVAVSQDLAGILQKTYTENKIVVIENGIDIDESPNPKPEVLPHTEQTVFKIAIAGRLSPIKRIDMFIRTAQHLHQTHAELSLDFRIYGDGPLREELEQLNARLQTDDIVHFKGHCGNMKHELEQLDMLLMTSDHEGLPMILLEAMAARVAIIAHAVGGIPNLLNNGKCGVLIQENDPASYAEAIYRMTQQAQGKSKIVELAFARLNDYYSADKNAKSYLATYQNLTS